MNHKDLTYLIKLAKKNRLKYLQWGDVRFEFLEDMKKTEQGEIRVGAQMPSDDEMLYYSSDSAVQVPKN